MKRLKWNGMGTCSIERGLFHFNPGQVHNVPDEVAERYKSGADWEIMNDESRDKSRTEKTKTKGKKKKEE